MSAQENKLWEEIYAGTRGKLPMVSVNLPSPEDRFLSAMRARFSVAHSSIPPAWRADVALILQNLNKYSSEEWYRGLRMNCYELAPHEQAPRNGG